ncbi:hypothetical protein ACFVVL_14875 [Kitasatospora sp. NPDC058115]|uniref:hypothetical protein n=1 Tax=Kitasatospora sp. NPDC058115 TaxID=3346347 RepID=UPI0036DB3C75
MTTWSGPSSEVRIEPCRTSSGTFMSTDPNVRESASRQYARRPDTGSPSVV